MRVDSNSLLTFLPIILIIGVFYLLVMRPQAKKRKAQQEKLQAVKVAQIITEPPAIENIDPPKPPADPAA